MLRKKLAGFLGILMVSVSVLAGCSDAKADKAVQVTEGKETQGQEAQKEKTGHRSQPGYPPVPILPGYAEGN